MTKPCCDSTAGLLLIVQAVVRAMDVDEHCSEGSMLSLVLAGIDASKGGDLLSWEDAAWVNSCLIHEADILGNNWDAVKDELLELISSEQNLTSPSTNENDGRQSEMDTGAFLSLEQVATSKRPARRASDLVLTKIDEIAGGDFTSQEDPSSPINFKNVFQPSYKEILEDMFDWDEELKLDVSEAGSSRQDIFKVWDLNIPVEEGELFSQLQNSFQQPSSGQPEQSLRNSNYSNNWQEPEGDLVNLNDLVSGIAVLSLKEMSS